MLAGIATFSFVSYRHAASALVVEKDLQLASFSATRLEDELRKLSDELLVLARTDDLVSGDATRQRQGLARARRRLSVFDGGVVLLDGVGKVRAAVPPRPLELGQDWSDRPYFQRLLGSSDTVFDHTLTDGPAGAPAVVVSVPVLGRDGEFEGALLGMFRLGEPTVSAFYAGIIRLRIGQSGNTFLVAKDGTVLYDSEVARVGSNFGQTAIPGLALTDLGSAFRTRDAAGNDVVAAQVPVPGTPWHLVTEDDWGTLTKTTWPYLRLLVAALALGMLVPVGMTVSAVRGRSRHEAALARATDPELVTRTMLEALLPQRAPVLPGWRIVLRQTPGEGEACCLYDWRLLANGTLVLALAEAAESPVRAIPHLATARAAWRSAGADVSPTAILTATNRVLAAEDAPGPTLRGAVLCVDPTSGRVMAAGAALAPYLIREGCGVPVEVGGPALGSQLDPSFRETLVTVAPTEVVVLCAPSMLDARNAGDVRFEDGPLQTVLSTTTGGARDLARALLASAAAHTASTGYVVGGTVIVVERLVDPRTAPPELEPDDEPA